MAKKVITYGTFDLFHVGHVRLLERLASLGDHLTVCISTDTFNAGKGKVAVMPYDQRAELVAACRFVDKVIAEESWDQKRDDIRREKIDIFAMGDDWEGKFDDLKDLCEVVYLPRTKDISTTALKTVIGEMRHASALESTTEQAEPRGVDGDTFAAILETARNGKLDNKKYQGFLELLTEREDKSNPDWLRCWILLHCLTRKKAFRTQNLIAKYNRISRRKKKMGDYEDFMALLFGELALLRPIGGKYSKDFTSADIDSIIEQTKAVMDKLSVYGRDVFANSGTLLGIVRQGTLLAHDNDVDLGVLLQADNEADAAAEWLALSDRMIADGVAVQRSEWSHVTLKLHKIGMFGVDLFPAWIDASGRLYVYPHTFGNLTGDQLLPLRRDAATALATPRDAEAMLASNYGNDWRIPNEGWAFDWPGARKKFSAFLSHIPGAKGD